MTQITKINIDKNNLNIEYKGIGPTPPIEDGTVIMSYYGQWNIYDGKFPVPSYANAKTDIYDKITHLAYGFMGFNGTGDIGSWDAWADLAGPKYVYGKDFYDLLPVDSNSFPDWGQGYSVGYPFTKQKFPSTSIIGTPSEGQQFYRLAFAKYLKPDMKIIMSFGGWEYGGASADSTWDANTPPAQVFYNITQNPSIFTKFVDNIVDIIKNYKFQIIEYENKYYPIPYTTPNGNLSSPTVHPEVKDGNLENGYTRVGSPFSLFSGVDIDWEYPSGCDQCAGCTGTTVRSVCPLGWTPSDVQKSYDEYASLLSKLKDKLPSPYFVSTTCGGDPSGITELVANPNIATAFNKIDRISIMSYDFMNGNNIITHDAPLYKQKIGSKEWNTDAAVTNMLTKIQPKKINIGVPYYGRFQYIEEDTLKTLGYIGGVPTQDITNKIFSGTTKGLYTACGQSTLNGQAHPITCPWVDGNPIGINSINYDITPTTPVVPDKLCGGNCNFSSVKEKFNKVDDTDKGVTYYISKETFTNTDILNGKESRIILSMPSQYSITQKTDYVKSKGLGGVITWMIGNDTSFQLADYVYNGIK